MLREIYLRSRDEYNELVPSDHMDLLLTKKNAKELLRILNVYLETFPDERIENEYKEFYRQYFPRMYGLKPGYVYLMKDSLGRYKIGMSSDPQRRLSQLSEKHKGMEILHTTPCDQMEHAETFLHNRFLEQCIRWEWFDLSVDDIDYIKSLAEYKDGEFILR